MPYRTGELTERVELQALTRTDDGYGGYTETWAAYATAWALVRPMRGGERARAQAVDAQANYLVVIRYRADVEVTHRILWRGKTLNVVFVSDEGPRAMYLPIECEQEA